MFSCRLAGAPRSDPIILVGDERVMPSELRRRPSTRESYDATRTWAILAEGVVFAPLANKIVQAGSPSVGWKMVEDWFEKQGGAAQQDLWITKKKRGPSNTKGGRPLGMDPSRGRCREHACVRRCPQDRGYVPPINRPPSHDRLRHGTPRTAQALRPSSQ